MAGFTPDPEKTMLKPPTLQVLIKFLCDVRWQERLLSGSVVMPLLNTCGLLQA